MGYYSGAQGDAQHRRRPPRRVRQSPPPRKQKHVPARVATWGGGPAAPWPLAPQFGAPSAMPGSSGGFGATLSGLSGLAAFIPGVGAPLSAALAALPAVVTMGEPIVSGLGTIAAPLVNAVESLGSAVADELTGGATYTAEQVARNQALTAGRMDATTRQYVLGGDGTRMTRGALTAGDLRDDVLSGFKSCTGCARSIRRVWKRFRRR